jgi:hypothetical protein
VAPIVPEQLESTMIVVIASWLATLIWFARRGIWLTQWSAGAKRLVLGCALYVAGASAMWVYSILLLPIGCGNWVP